MSIKVHGGGGRKHLRFVCLLSSMSLATMRHYISGTWRQVCFRIWRTTLYVQLNIAYELFDSSLCLLSNARYRADMSVKYLLSKKIDISMDWAAREYRLHFLHEGICFPIQRWLCQSYYFSSTTLMLTLIGSASLSWHFAVLPGE